MILLGKTQTLTVHKTTDFGIYLSDPNAKKIEQQDPSDDTAVLDADSILLPKSQVPADTKINDTLSVFVYKDSEDRPIATMMHPGLELGGLAKLKVKEVGNIGAFLDWGLAKDLFLPFKQQTRPVEVNEEIHVGLYIDKSQRLCATMKIYPYLATDSTYQKGEWVDGIVYELLDSFGAFVVVDDRYSALIPKKVLHKTLTVGAPVHARITTRLEDGKLELSLNDAIPAQMTQDADLILKALTEAGGFLPYHDKTDPALIDEKFSLSKNAFKRAIGNLMKSGKIKIAEDGIRSI